MNFNAPLVRAIRYILFPVSLLYGAVVSLRHWLFNRNIFHSASFDRPVICVGNISAGGTGKSPMIEYLIRMLQQHCSVAVVSRGYGRTTKGYLLADDHTTAAMIGDEPRQFLDKFPYLTLAVGEDRQLAISRLLNDMPDTQVVLLDDAFQHRWVKASMNIVLTRYDDLYTRDWLLPTGHLRDIPAAIKRADVIVVTKCPDHLQEADRTAVLAEIKPLAHQAVFFAGIRYAPPQDYITKSPVALSPRKKVLLVTGIAAPEPLEHYLKEHVLVLETIRYPDHHSFSMTDIQTIQQKYAALGKDTLLLTTEKDAVRLVAYKQQLADIQWAVIPIGLYVLFNEAEAFEQIVMNEVKNAL